ncbi:MAG: GNAT family N-acetyltransferase [Actinomycetota bacterium]|nr:GNAT family N-acetyltransferase [Actinomycetota bacterium]
MIEVRDAHPDDADAIAAAHIEGWRTGYRHLLPDELLDAPHFAAERTDRWRAWTWNTITGSQLFVPVMHGRVVGFGHAGPERVQPTCDASGTALGTVDGTVDGTASGTPSGTAGSTPGSPATLLDSGRGRGEVYGFYLHPDSWGSGAAGALMARCTESLRTMGFMEAVLWVLRDNPRARAFYEKAGWLATGRHSSFAGSQTGRPLPEPLPEVEYAISLR